MRSRKRVTEKLPQRPVFATVKLNQRLSERDRSGCDGLEKSWVHTTQIGWLRHYRQRRDG